MLEYIIHKIEYIVHQTLFGNLYLFFQHYDLFKEKRTENIKNIRTQPVYKLTFLSQCCYFSLSVLGEEEYTLSMGNYNHKID